MPLQYGISEDTNEEFKILVAITFETTYSGLSLDNEKLIEIESNKFYSTLLNILEKQGCEYQIYDSVLV